MTNQVLEVHDRDPTPANRSEVVCYHKNSFAGGEPTEDSSTMQ